MAIKQSTGFCFHCNEQILTTKQCPNHILHLFLTIITGGLWLIIWLIISMTSPNWRCSKCGLEINEKPKKSKTGCIIIFLLFSIILIIPSIYNIVKEKFEQKELITKNESKSEKVEKRPTNIVNNVKQ